MSKQIRTSLPAVNGVSRFFVSLRMTGEGKMAKGNKGKEKTALGFPPAPDKGGRAGLWLILCLVVVLTGCNRKEFTNPNDPANAPPAPQLISPVGDTLVYDNPPRFRWSDVESEAYPDGVTFQFLCAEDADFADPLVNTTCWSSSFDPDMLLRERCFWKVRARVRGGSENAWGEWSSVHSFRERFPLVEECRDIPGGEQISLADDYAYVMDYSNLHVLDVSDPARPGFLGSLSDSLVDRFLGVAKEQDNLYAVCDEDYLSDYGPYAVRVYSVSDPSSPEFAGICSLGSLRSSCHTAVSYPALYLTDGYGITIVDISNPESPSVIDTIPEYPEYGLLVRDAYLVVLTSSRIKVYDISDPFHPCIANSHMFASEIWCVSGDTLFTARDTYLGTDITLFDISALPSIVELTSLEGPCYVYGMYSSGNCVAFRSSSGLCVLELGVGIIPPYGILRTEYYWNLVSANRGYLYLFRSDPDRMSVVRLCREEKE